MIMMTKYVYTTLLRRSGYDKGGKEQEEGGEEEEHYRKQALRQPRI